MSIAKRIIATMAAGTMLFTGVSLRGITQNFSEVTVLAASTTTETYTYGDFEYIFLDDGTIEISDCSTEESDIEVPTEIDGVTVTSIGRSAFSDQKFTSIVLPDSIVSIGESAFYACYSLTSITIPGSVTAIKARTFYSCTKLEDIHLPDGITSIGDMAFYGCAFTEFIIPASVTEIGAGVFTMQSITTIEVESGNPAYTSVDGVLYTKDLTTLVAYPKNREGSTYTLADATTEIAANAFASNTKLTEIILPEGLTTIGREAFFYCQSLETINLPDTIHFIDEAAFYFCNSLSDLDFPKSINSIEESTFWYCYAFTDLVIPENITVLGNWAFSKCTGLTTVTLSNTMTEIGGSAFWGCSAITDVYFYGTEEEWNAITIDSGNEYLTEATIHFLGSSNPTTTETSTTEETTTTTTETSTTELTTETTAETSTTQTTTTNDFLPGDCNNDGLFSISDVVLLQRWLLNVSGTSLNNWEAADLCEDGQINAFDLCVMKQMLLGL
ncbi:MAG: leucine-rich repeat protein [Ruminococcus sp.]|nr:leucine-rich repeat protein [Ruminococcus sp.]